MDVQVQIEIEEMVRGKGKYISQDCYELHDANGRVWYVLLNTRGPNGEYQLGFGSPQYCIKSPEPKTPEKFLAFLDACLHAV